MPAVDTRTRSVLWAVLCGIGALVVLVVPMSVTVLLMAAGWSGCLLDCTDASQVQPGLFWGSLAMFCVFVAAIVVWVITGYRRFPRRWTIAASVLLLLSVVAFFVI